MALCISGDSALDILALKLLKARWLHSYGPGDAGICRLVWTKLGAGRRNLLKRIIDEFHLKDNSQTALDFSRGQIHHERASENFEKSAREFWLACCEELDVVPDKALSRAFVEIMAAGDPQNQTSTTAEFITLLATERFLAGDNR